MRYRLRLAFRLVADAPCAGQDAAMTIEALLIAGVVVGLLIGIFTTDHGCAVLLIVPGVMVGYTALWQMTHSESLRSTSALDYLFAPLWPTIGAVTGFVASRAFKSMAGWIRRKAANRA